MGVVMVNSSEEEPKKGVILGAKRVSEADKLALA
jgi:hypothetical protein